MKSMYVKKVWPALLAAFLVGCGSQPENESGAGTPERETRVLNINSSDHAQGSLDDRFTLKEIIPLDTAKAALLNSGRVNQVAFIGNQVILSDYSPIIRVFNRKDGSLYKAINRSGRGPEEYSSLAKSFMKDGEHLVMLGFDNALLYYDLDGNFIRKTELIRNKTSFLDLCSISGGFLTFRGLAGLYTHKDQTVPYYSVKFLSEAGDTLRQMVPIPLTWPKVPLISTNSTFYKHRQDVFLIPISENTIYRYFPADTTFLPAYVLNLDNIDVNAVMERSALKEKEEKFSFMKEMFMPMCLGITDTYMLLVLNGKGNNGSFLLINRKNGGYELFDRTNEMGGWIPNEEGVLVRLLDYSDLTDTDGNIPDTPLIRRIREVTPITEQMNGVLCIYEDKN